MATKVAVIMGGASFERNFSLKSGALVSEALEKRGYEVLPLDADAHLVDTLRAEKPDVAFVCLHGRAEKTAQYLHFWSSSRFRMWVQGLHLVEQPGTRLTCRLLCARPGQGGVRGHLASSDCADCQCIQRPWRCSCS